MSAQDNTVARTLYRALTDMSRQLIESQARANELERLAQEREAALAALTAQMNELLAQRRDGRPQTEPALASLYGVEGQIETAPAPDAPQNEWPAQPAEAERLAAEREAALTQLTDQLRQAQAWLDEAQQLAREREAALAVVDAQTSDLEAQLNTTQTEREQARAALTNAERLAAEREAVHAQAVEQLSAARAQVGDHQAQLGAAQDQLEQTKAALRRAEQRTKDTRAAAAQIRELETQLGAARTQLAEAGRGAAEREAALDRLAGQLREAQARLDLDRDREATLATLTTQANELQAQLESAHTALEEARGERASAERLAFERETALSQLTQQLSDLQARADEARAPAHHRTASPIPARKREAHVRTSSARRNHKAPKPRKTRSPKRR